MINHLTISGFKCFNESEFDLNEVTVLTGSNGTGKSSLIQTLLLLRLAIEKNFQHFKGKEYNKVDWKGMTIPLNNGYELKLGTVFDIFRDNKVNETKISLKLDGDNFEFMLPDNEEEDTSVKVNYLPSNNIIHAVTPFWLKEEFYYLNTERLGPRQALDLNHTDFIHCGYKGEFTAQVLINCAKKSNFKSAMINDKTKYLGQLVDNWVESICPGTSITASAIASMNAQIKVRSSASKSEMLATNIGFGISYALPIIVTGLIAVKNSVFIVENPEAHLHPKGQSNMGYFLGKVAASGVKVIIETHSEHIVNGIRRAALSSEGLSPKDVGIYFFNGFDEQKKIKIKDIYVKENGDLSGFPKDFFDQVNQDMAEIFRLKNKNFNNG